MSMENEKNAAALASALGGLKGPLMKVAQLLSTIPDALPAEYAEELATLQMQAPPMGWAFVKRRMAAELGPDWQTKFAAFSHEAAAAASLGQVHKARALDGRELAAKLQYPDMQSAVEADLTAASSSRSTSAATGRSRLSRSIRDRARLREELDYAEAHMALYGDAEG
jgi:predicted unusual protein kinase regulating ubiquinone biosynthesis (AarF/ABC1/UbiB family)